MSLSRPITRPVDTRSASGILPDNSTPIFASPLINPPGTHYKYSDINLLVLGFIIEKLRGAPLDQVVHDRITALHQEVSETRELADALALFATTSPDPAEPDAWSKRITSIHFRASIERLLNEGTGGVGAFALPICRPKRRLAFGSVDAADGHLIERDEGAGA